MAKVQGGETFLHVGFGQPAFFEPKVLYVNHPTPYSFCLASSLPGLWILTDPLASQLRPLGSRPRCVGACVDLAPI